MSNIVTMQVPPHIAARIAARKAAPAPSAIASIFAGSSYPKISTRASRYRLVEDGVETVIGIEMDVVIVGANPKESRAYYEGAYVPGDNKAPDCSSDSGDVPNPGVPKPQSPNCATCRHAALGSKMTPAGKQSTACSKARNLAVVAAADPSKVYGLSVSVSAMKDLREYIRDLTNYGINPEEVVTTLGFDDKVDYPKVTFKQKPNAFVPEGALPMITDIMNSEDVKIVTRQIAGPGAPALPNPAPAAQQAPAIAPPAYTPPPVNDAAAVAAKAAADLAASQAATAAKAAADLAAAQAAVAAAQAAATAAADLAASSPTTSAPEATTPAAPLTQLEGKLAALFG